MIAPRAEMRRDHADDEALTAVKRGASLIKYCTNAKPHVVYATCTERGLTWVGKRRKEKTIAASAIARVIAGRHTEKFRRRRDADADGDADARSFSVVYEDGSGKASKTWDGVCESEYQRDLWVRALERVMAEAREDVARRTSDDGGRREFEDARDGGISIGTAVRVSSAIGKFKVKSPSLREREIQREMEETRMRAPTRACNVPNEAVAWGWRADVTPESAVESISGGGFAAKSERWTRVDTPSAIEGMETLDVVEISIGARHTLARTRTGAVYSWGEGKGGKLGIPSGQDFDRPTRVDLDGRAVALSCGSAHSVAVVEGEVFAWGDPNAAPGLLGLSDVRSVMWFPGKILFPSATGTLSAHRGARSLGGGGVKVVQVSCGPCHTACVTETGACYTWGEGSFFALGHGDRESYRAPRKLETFTRERRVVLRVSCGVWHTAAIVAASGSSVVRVPVPTNEESEFDPVDGELFTWGDGETGQLGIRDSTEAPVPTKTSNQLGEPGSEVCSVSCGQHHTVALTSQGDLWLAGCVGKVDNSVRTTTFTRLTDFETGSVRTVASGENHVVASTRDARVFSWGVGKNGRLGLGRNDRDQPVPQEIVNMRGREVLHIACGPTSSACVLRGVQMTIKAKASMARLSTFSIRQPSMLRVSASIKPPERKNSSSNMETASTSTPNTAKDKTAQSGSAQSGSVRSGTTGTVGSGGRAKGSQQGLKSEKAVHRLLSVLSPTYENVAKTSNRTYLKESLVQNKPLDNDPARSLPSPLIEPLAPRAATPELVEPTKLECREPSPAPAPPSPPPSPPPFTVVEAPQEALTEETFIQSARRVADEAEASLTHLAEERAVLERATQAAIAARGAERHTKPPSLRHKVPNPSRRSNVPIGEPKVFTEEVEEGVFMTLEVHGDKTILKRVRFSKRIFSNELARQWWEENRDRLTSDLDLTIPT